MLSDGRRVWQQVAELVGQWGAELTGERGLSSVGAVVGATYPRAVGEARRLLPRAVMLLPGIGAQGAGPADVARAFTSGPASALVTASRSIVDAHVHFWDPHTPWDAPSVFGEPFAEDPIPAWYSEEVRAAHWRLPA